MISSSTIFSSTKSAADRAPVIWDEFEFSLYNRLMSCFCYDFMSSIWSFKNYNRNWFISWDLFTELPCDLNIYGLPPSVSFWGKFTDWEIIGSNVKSCNELNNTFRIWIFNVEFYNRKFWFINLYIKIW